MAGLADKLAKFSAVIEKLDKKANIIDAIDVFKAFSGWLEFRGKPTRQLLWNLSKKSTNFRICSSLSQSAKAG